MVELYQTKPTQVRVVKYTGTNETEIERFIDAVVTNYPTIRNNVKICIDRDKIVNFPINIARKYTNYTADDCFDSILKISLTHKEKYYIMKNPEWYDNKGLLCIIYIGIMLFGIILIVIGCLPMN